jgi:hypothetical protein
MTRTDKQRSKVRVVFFSDTHGRYWQTEIPEGDILVFAGDIAGIGSLDDLTDFNIYLGNCLISTKSSSPATTTSVSKTILKRAGIS